MAIVARRRRHDDGGSGCTQALVPVSIGFLSNRESGIRTRTETGMKRFVTVRASRGLRNNLGRRDNLEGSTWLADRCKELTDCDMAFAAAVAVGC